MKKKRDKYINIILILKIGLFLGLAEALRRKVLNINDFLCEYLCRTELVKGLCGSQCQFLFFF